ncbi:MAG: cbb3-type cytochrome c oxidase subunit 3 [Deltaproteobacteria bacterium]
MRLGDIMSSMQLSSYAEVALLLFLGAFVAVLISVVWSRQTEEWEHCRNLPLDDADPSPSSGAPATVALATRRDEP